MLKYTFDNTQSAFFKNLKQKVDAYFAEAKIDPAGNRKLSKQKSHGRIDGAVALAMAMSVAGTYQDEAVSFWEVA